MSVVKQVVKAVVVSGARDLYKMLFCITFSKVIVFEGTDVAFPRDKELAFDEKGAETPKMTTTCVLAIDIGGTKIASCLIDPAAPTTILDYGVRPTRAFEGPETVLEQVLDSVDRLVEAAAVRGATPIAVGIGSPGVINSDTATVVSIGQTMPGWDGTKLGAIVHTHCGLPVRAANDVRVMALGEARHGGGRGFKRLAVFALGTGIGGAIIEDGHLPSTAHYCCGEVTFICAPTIFGGCDIIENVGAGPALAQSYRTVTGATDETLTLREVMDRYRGGEKAAIDVINTSMACTGRAIAGFVNAVDADAIILGGGVVGIGAPIVDPLTRGIREHLLTGLADIPIKQATLGTNAQLVGAGVLATTALET